MIKNVISGEKCHFVVKNDILGPKMTFIVENHIEGSKMTFCDQKNDISLSKHFVIKKDISC